MPSLHITVRPTSIMRACSNRQAKVGTRPAHACRIQSTSTNTSRYHDSRKSNSTNTNPTFFCYFLYISQCLRRIALPPRPLILPTPIDLLYIRNREKKKIDINSDVLLKGATHSPFIARFWFHSSQFLSNLPAYLVPMIASTRSCVTGSEGRLCWCASAGPVGDASEES
jgi:hypothetical protein